VVLKSSKNRREKLLFDKMGAAKRVRSYLWQRKAMQEVIGFDGQTLEKAIL